MISKKILQKIIATQALDQLDTFKEASTWDPLDHTERELLAMLFVKQGEALLNKDNVKVFKTPYVFSPYKK